MYKKWLLLTVLLMSNTTQAGLYKCKDDNGRSIYSDIPCSGASVTQAKPNKAQAINADRPSAQSQPNDTSNETSFTKELSAMQTPDAASKSCFNHVNTTENYPDPSTSKLLSSQKKWVSVKNVGARQMVTIVLTSKNIAGLYVGKQSYQCLMMGDGVTVNSKPAELL